MKYARFAFQALALAVLGCIVLAIPAHAQEQRTATISFTKPTKFVDGTDIPAGTVITYSVYQGAKGSSTKPKVATINGTSTTINTGLQPGETCWQVTAVANGRESAMSNEGCKSFPWPATEPVIITVT
jgi:fibronectin type 3 domain-containing protein